MSTSLNNLRRIASRDVKDHTAILDLYLCVGRDLEYLSIKFGMDPEDLINLLEGYGEKIRFRQGEYAGEDPEILHSIRTFGVALDDSGRGRLAGIPRILIEDYVAHFYPGIASEHPENDWINLERFYDQTQPGWRVSLEAGAGARREDAGHKKRSRGFRLFG